ncbi:MAG: hypothetical protein QNJ68_11375 [Microcoleaceae cyanobacterium MO_207.B10]|nr:hypothetical protein [Microcoleaceae cyanobacterium MO_207.B10]
MLHYIDNYNYEDFLANLPDLEENRIFYNQILKQLNDKELIELRKVYKTFEEEKDPLSSSISQLIPEPVPSFMPPRRKKDIDLKTVKHTENIDSIISNVKYNFQKSRTTDLGKKFIQFIENPLV